MSAAARGLAPLPVNPNRCADARLLPRPDDLARIRAATLCLVNQERRLHGERPLRAEHHLRSAAQRHSEDMVARDYFAHVGPRGDSELSRIRASGYLPHGPLAYEVGENIGCGTLGLATPYATVEAWIASPPHRANILDSRFRDSGIGVAARAPASLSGGQPGATYTEDFGVVLRHGAHR